MTTLNDSEALQSNDNATVIVQTPTQAVPAPVYSLTIPGTIPGVFNTLKATNGYSFIRPFATQIPGSRMYGPFNGITKAQIDAQAVSNVGWEVSITDGTTLTLMALVPRFYTLSFSKEWSNEGSGQIVIDRSDPIFGMMTMSQGAGTDLVNKENIITVYYEGAQVFEFLAQSIDETQVDATTEQQPVTISGPGTANTLQRAKVFSPGFPNVVYKITSVADSFSSPKINTTLWNLTDPSNLANGTIYVDTSSGAAANIGRAYPTYTAPALSGGPFDITNCGISASIKPIALPSPPTNLFVNPDFANGVQGWDANTSAVQNAGAGLGLYTGDSQDGTGNCMEVDCTSASVSAQGAEQTFTGQPAWTNYWIIGWVKWISGEPPTVVAKDTTNNVIASTSVVSVKNEWVQLGLPFQTGINGNATVVVSFNSGPTAGQSHFLLSNTSMYQNVSETYTRMTVADISDPTNNYAEFFLDWGASFLGEVSNNGDVQNFTLRPAYDPIYDAYWRLREFNGSIYFDTSPDGATWNTLGSAPYSWDASNVSISFSTSYGEQIPWDVVTGFLPMQVKDINSGTNPGLVNTYSSVPNMSIFLDLLKQAQRRGCVPYILPQFTVAKDSAGKPWTDTASLSVANGGDLETQLQASVAAIAGDWIMQPGFQLYAGNPGSLGTDHSDTVIFHQSGQMTTSERLRVRDQIANYVVAEDGSGNLTLSQDATSIGQWDHREGYVQSQSPTTVATLQQMSDAALREYKDELSSRTLEVPPDLPARKVFHDYDVGDWVGVQDSDLSLIESLRVMVIAVSVDQTENTTVELTLNSRIMLLSEMMSNLLTKIGSTAAAQVLPAPGASAQQIGGSVTSGTTPALVNYAQVVGDGSTTVFPVVHSLGTKSVHLSVWGTASPFTLLAPSNYTVTADSTSQVTVTFSTAPTVGQYRIVVSL